ncbi:amidohydrolase [Kordiimonas pumila]|uniref:Amidohydrolase n=1 Tax=Kordiimonas pumila TaxID=2161677 RepID=A0ABV7D879_9PROT|nr:amidohydrolase [Kordiimonas pumila]
MNVIQIVSRIAIITGLASVLSLPSFSTEGHADLILYDATIWTVDPANPEAQAVAIEGNRIIKVGKNEDVLALKGTDTKLINLDGKMVLPGFIDAHTHMENAINAFYELRLNSVSTEEAMLALIKDRAERIPDEYWITGGNWSSKTGWAAEKSGDYVAYPYKSPTRKDGASISFELSLVAVDALTPNQPVLLKRFDGAYFINSAGLQLLHIDKNTPDPSGGHYQHDPKTGELTGMLFGTAGEKAKASLPPRSHQQVMFGARNMVAELTSYGLTGLHDIVRIPDISDKTVFETNAERSMTDLTIFTSLREENSLKQRIYPILPAIVWNRFDAFGYKPQGGDEMISYGAVKMFLDGFLMFRHYPNNDHFSGSLSFRNHDVTQLRNTVLGADKAGWDIAMHVTGDKGHALTFDWFEDTLKANPNRERRFRILHAWYPRMEEIDRGGRMHMIADVTPFHLIRELKSMPQKLYDDQKDTAFAWQTMVKKGWRLNIVSDWPGSYDGNHGAPVSPLENIYLATTRMDFDAPQGSGWHTQEALTVDQAIEAYTINPAWASYEEDIKGTITEGKLADLIVLSKNIREIPKTDILKTQVLYTVFDGQIVFDALSAKP